ncbi:MAG: oxygen-dependent coproporphyrinogen oxidase [Saprospiraceae bacterium]|nr:oxygen-dependent coproporphyrinogen oxidase [Saprospiraceae bacterium]
MTSPSLDHIIEQFRALQDQICTGLEALDGVGHFKQDLWTMDHGGGGGRTRIIQGEHIEKGGVNFSHVSGEVSEKLSRILKKEGSRYHATGVSIVLHPVNPFVPIIHMNVRYFEMDESVWWFGGGIDLTPHYIVPDEAAFLHRSLEEACRQTDPQYYEKFKKWADDYFYLSHRQETRGVGGIFFDRLGQEQPHSKEALHHFVMRVGRSFLPIYSRLFEQNFDREYQEEHVHWRNYRRGRYVEFNLVWDRGTRFGLETGGRTESILMSLPGTAQWEYNYRPGVDSEEAFTLAHLKKGIDWINGNPK